MMTSDFLSEIKMKGWVLLPSVLDSSLITDLREGLDVAYAKCREVQVSNGLDANTDGTVHHVLNLHPSFLTFLNGLYCHAHIEAFFGNPYILNTYGGVINIKHKLAYVGNIHRDIRTFYNIPMMMNMLVMIDDFTLDNGATYVLSGSHLEDEQPTEDVFYKNAERCVGAAGSIVLFDSLMWHAAGANTTDSVRRALTLAFTRPFMKQQLDYPRLLGYDRGEEFNEDVRQILGYNSRVPSNLHEWYQPRDKRFYKPDQG